MAGYQGSRAPAAWSEGSAAVRSRPVTGTRQPRGQTTGDHGTGQTTAQLQAPTDDTGIYADWDDDQWDFGEADEYPVLVVDFDGDGDATWEEFGYQLRKGRP